MGDAPAFAGVMMATSGNPESSASAALKEQLGLISFLVLFAGLVSTDTYYSAFGVRYQLLDFPVQHLIYRGVTAILGSLMLGLAYILAMMWLAAGATWFADRQKLAGRWVQLASYAVLVPVVAIAYPASIQAGRAAALQDMDQKASSLPRVRDMRTAKGDQLQVADDRLLLATKDLVIYFRPVASPNEVPFVHLARREDLGEILVSR